MSEPGAVPLFIDTGAFFGHFVENSPRHNRARAVMDAIRTGTFHFRPIYTTGYVPSELTKLILRKTSHEQFLNTLQRIRASPAVTVLHPNAARFDTICGEFACFDDQQISFVDHTTAVFANEANADHVFAFDSDFRTLGFSLVPDDIIFHSR